MSAREWVSPRGQGELWDHGFSRPRDLEQGPLSSVRNRKPSFSKQQKAGARRRKSRGEGDAAINRLDKKLCSIERAVKVQAVFTTVQAVILLLSACAAAWAGHSLVLPELRSMAMSAEQMARASVPLSQTAEEVLQISKHVGDVSEAVGETVAEVTSRIDVVIDHADGLYQQFSAGFNASEFLEDAREAAGEAAREVGGGLAEALLGPAQQSGGLIGSAASQLSGALCENFGLGCPGDSGGAEAREAGESAGAALSREVGEGGEIVERGEGVPGSMTAFLESDAVLGNALEEDSEQDRLAIRDALAQTGQVALSAVQRAATGLWCNIVNCDEQASDTVGDGDTNQSSNFG